MAAAYSPSTWIPNTHGEVNPLASTPAAARIRSARARYGVSVSRVCVCDHSDSLIGSDPPAGRSTARLCVMHSGVKSKCGPSRRSAVSTQARVSAGGNPSMPLATSPRAAGAGTMENFPATPQRSHTSQKSSRKALGMNSTSARPSPVSGGAWLTSVRWCR